MQRPLILASTSPRRQELLRRMGLQFTVLPSDFDEYLDHNRPAEQVAIALGLGKARAVAARHPEALVIGGDTIVTLRGRQLDKPKDLETAGRWLREHAGQDAVVTSSVVLVCNELGLEIAGADAAVVHFRPYNAARNESYLATGDWADKAGGWGIQSGAAPLIEYLTGRYDTVLGLPTQLLAEMLASQGITAQPVQLTPPVMQRT